MAQWVESLPCKHKALGSIPSAAKKKKKKKKKKKIPKNHECFTKQTGMGQEVSLRPRVLHCDTLRFHGNRSQRCSLMPHSMARGLSVLQSMASRDSQNPEQRQRRDQRSLSKSAQAISHYSRKMSELQDMAGPAGFVSEMEEMRRVFFRRPGCPQFSTRATSVSHLGSATVLGLPREACVSPETWRMAEDPLLDRRGSNMGVDSKEPRAPACPAGPEQEDVAPPQDCLPLRLWETGLPGQALLSPRVDTAVPRTAVPCLGKTAVERLCPQPGPMSLTEGPTGRTILELGDP
uniref:Uncharacterized protein n=1 Tax=Sciurus vulgaris TaxID=55149 RepID=A0A8D2AK10_SCIVU